MATVRITDTLRAEVDYVIRQQFETRRTPLNAQLDNLLGPTPELTEAIAGTVREMMQTNATDLSKVPQWLQMTNTITAHEFNGVPVPYRRQTIRFSQPIPWPTIPGGVVLTKLKSGRLAHWATQLQTINTTLDALAEEEKAFREQVRSLLNSCTTYRQALELWPQLTSVTPAHILHRHEAEAVRVKAAPPSVKLDVAALNKTAVVNTIAASNKERTS
jgi:hypothetical protein